MNFSFFSDDCIITIKINNPSYNENKIKRNISYWKNIKNIWMTCPDFQGLFFLAQFKMLLSSLKLQIIIYIYINIYIDFDIRRLTKIWPPNAKHNTFLPSWQQHSDKSLDRLQIILGSPGQNHMFGDFLFFFFL